MKKERKKLKVRIVRKEDSFSYEAAVQGPDEPRTTKVSVTVDRGLLAYVEHYIVWHPAKTRNEIFYEALAAWAKQIQEKADLECYVAGAKTSQARQSELDDWTAVKNSATSDIW